jgi:glycerol-3-phosphate acyltransferase PlsY
MLLYFILVAVALVVAYFCGSIPVGLIVGKFLGDIDIRQHGSGNTGTTNALRTMGWGPGLLVFAGDVFKGALGCLLVSFAVSFSVVQALTASAAIVQEAAAAGLVAGSAAAAIDPLANALIFSDSSYILDIPMALAVLACVFGHMFSPFMHFKGGKGIATALGCLIVVLPLAAICALAVFGVVVLASRIVSVGSMAAIASLPVFTYIFYGSSITYIVFTIFLAIVVIAAHRKNIIRISKGEEPRFSVGKKPE